MNFLFNYVIWMPRKFQGGLYDTKTSSSLKIVVVAQKEGVLGNADKVFGLNLILIELNMGCILLTDFYEARVVHAILHPLVNWGLELAVSFWVVVDYISSQTDFGHSWEAITGHLFLGETAGINLKGRNK